MTEWKDVVGHRLLLKNVPEYTSGLLLEATLREYSQGGRIKLDFYNGSKAWCDASRYEIVEDLGIMSYPLEKKS